MIYNYKRNTERRTWSEGGKSYDRKWVICWLLSLFQSTNNTGEKSKKKHNSNAKENLNVPLGPKKTVFSGEENELVDYLLNMESRFFGLMNQRFEGNDLSTHCKAQQSLSI